MSQPKSIMMWKASDKLSHILSTQYLLMGSMSASLWTLGDSEFDKECASLTPGSLVLLFNNDGPQSVVIGGSYFLGWRNYDLKKTWELYGVNNGAYDYEDFVKEVIARGGNEKSVLSLALLAHTFIFEKSDYIRVPDEMAQFSTKHVFKLSLDEPLGRYLHSRILEERNNYITSEGNDWNGMYYAASHRNSKSYVAEFYSRVVSAYHFKCALSQTKARPVLMVAHIQPFYDDQFQKSSNGVLLRSDLYLLFRSGYITFVYSEDGNHLVAKVSNTVRAAYGDDYMRFDGKELTLPDNKEDWPDRRYTEWHNKYRFENWLHLSRGRNERI